MAIVTAAVLTALLARGTPVERPEPGSVAVDSTVPATTGRWQLRMGGWYISVDGAEVELPSLIQQTRPLVRVREPQPLSPYDHLIVQHSEEQGLDWRLIAALIFEESGFVHDAVSEKGAYGLMQVRPGAAADVGADRFESPSDNIQAGARYLKRLSKTFSDARGRDRLALALAAYNMGPGHVRDARALARRFGYDPLRWEDSVELMLPLLEQPIIYEELPRGYAQGTVTTEYVNRVLDRYDTYRRRFGSVVRHLDAGQALSDQAASASG